MTDAQAEEALMQQGLNMAISGIGTLAGMPARQRRVALVGGGGDGTMVPRGAGARYSPRFEARGEYEDGTGVEYAIYLYRRRRPHPAAEQVVDFVFDGLPDA